MDSRMSRLIDVPEHRSIAASDFEIRANGDSLTLRGYATVFDSPYDMYGGPPNGWSEIIDPGAFKRTLAEKPDLNLLINHEGMPLARTKSGTLQVSTDNRGLKVEAKLDRSDPDVQRLEPKMLRGDMDEMSFAFRVKAQQWSNDDTERRITEVSLHKGDVSVVNYGANPATSATLRSLIDNDALIEARDIEADDLIALRRRIDQVIAKRQGSAIRPGRLAMLRALGDSTDLPD